MFRAMEDFMERMLVKVGRSYRLIQTDEIDWMEAEGNYIRLHLNDQSFLMRQTMCGMEKKLDPGCFVRINRSAIVNVRRIRELKPDRNSRYFVVLDNDCVLSWGRAYRANLTRLIHGEKAG